MNGKALPAVAPAGALTTRRLTAAGLTAMGLLLPAIVPFFISAALRFWLPAVFRVAEKLPTPAVREVLTGNPAWASLLQHVARLEGVSTHDRAAAGRHVERALKLTTGVEDIAKLVGVREISSAEALRLFPAYVDAAQRLTKYVDGWSAQ